MTVILEKIKLKGFTLAELLVVLAILGVIATFTIPKLLNNMSNSQNKALFKETYSVLQSVVNQGITNNLFARANYNVYTFFAQHTNAVKLCSTSATGQGCWSGNTNVFPNYWGNSGLVLPSGAVILFGANNTVIGPAQNSDAVLIDVNGANGPDQEGVDQFILAFCSGPLVCDPPTPGWSIVRGPKTPGSIGPGSNGATQQAWDAGIWQ